MSPRVQPWVVLLRAVNVGGSGRMTMADLRAAVHDAGFPDAITYLQSGNLVLTSPGPAATIAGAVERAIASALGFSTHAMVRAAPQMQAIASPPPTIDPDPVGLAVAFCKSRPTAAARDALAARDFGRDHATPHGTECYLRYPDGMGRSKMTGAVLERVLGVPVTVRNWKVTRALAELVA